MKICCHENPSLVVFCRGEVRPYRDPNLADPIIYCEFHASVRVEGSIHPLTREEALCYEVLEE